MLKALKTRLNALRRKLANARLRPLPTTDDDMAVLIARSIMACGLDPTNDSLRQAVASTMLSLPQGSTKISVNQLRDVINQARCKQAAYSVIEELRAKDKAANEKAQQKAD